MTVLFYYFTIILQLQYNIDNNQKYKNMQEAQLNTQQCPNCRKSIQSSRLPIHVHMCSTMKLRQSRIFQYKNPQKTQNNNTSQCIFCMSQVNKDKIQQHMSSCQQRLIECQKCKNMFPLSLMQNHIQFCHKNIKQRHNSKDKKLSIVSKHETENKIQIKQQNKIVKETGSRITMNDVWNGLNIVGSTIVDKRNQLAKYWSQNKGPALQALTKLKNDFYQRIQLFFIRAASDPNVSGLPRDKIKLIEKGTYHLKKNGQQQQVCAICYCDILEEEPIKILECRHIYHPECIDKWMRINRKCPLCNHEQFKNK